MPRQSDFLSKKIDISAQKIDGSALITFDVVIAAFSVNNKNKKVKIFKKTLLLANISLDVILKILFPYLE